MLSRGQPETWDIRNAWILPSHKPLVIAFDGQGILYMNKLAMDSPMNYRGYPTTLKQGAAWSELDLPDGNTLTVSMAIGTPCHGARTRPPTHG
jgi:hypothetical protein